jgi:hypothetical protein
MEYKPLIIMPNSHWVIDMLLELIDKADIKVENTAASEVMYWLLNTCKDFYQKVNCVQATYIDTSFCSEGYSSHPDAHYAFKADLVIRDEDTYNYLTFSVYYNIDKFDFSFILKDKSDKIIDYATRKNLEQATAFKAKYGIGWYSFNAILYKCYCLIRQGDPKTKVIADWEKYLLKFGEKASKPIKILKSLLASDEQFNKSLTTKII